MPDKRPHIQTYSAAELMQYATGCMDPAQMHALEKAALEDPFLAEAMDGYIESVAAQRAATIQVQAKRLRSVPKQEQAKILPLWKRKSLRVAVAALFVAGAGWTVFSLLQKPAIPATAVVQQTPATAPLSDTNTTGLALANESAPQVMTADSSLLDTTLLSKDEGSSLTGTLALEKKKEPAGDFSISATPYSLQRADVQNRDTSQPMVTDQEVVTTKPSQPLTALRHAPTPEHVFKAQITDTRNNPLPYANVMIEGQDFGTYSDATGRFNLISNDSVLHIRVRSVGYTNQLLTLQSNRPENRIIMQEDQQLANSLPLTVQSKSKATAPFKKSIVERDSIVGQEMVNFTVPFYDHYLLNNNRISPLPVLNQQVQLSFDVSATGEPVNITIVKSSGGKALNEEAIRLVKEGPKLKADTILGKKKKITVRF